MSEEDKIPYLVENKERDTFTIYVKGTKPYLELQQENKQLKEQLENKIDLYEDTISYQLGFDKGKEYLQQIIDKAIEYIESHWIEYEEAKYIKMNWDELEIPIEEIKELLEILGDKE